MQEESKESNIDVRIIVSDLNIAHIVSKAIDNIDFKNDYNIVVSSIIPTVELDIVKKVVTGADILLIGGYGNDETFNILFNELKNDFNHIGLFNYDNIMVNDDSYNYKLTEKEVLNSIIKSTVAHSLNLINIHSLENKLRKVSHNYNNLLDDYNQLIHDYEIASNKNKDLFEELENLKEEYYAFKLRFEDIYSKDFLEIYNVYDLWQELFHHDLKDEKKLVIATNEFKPENIIVGQGYIAAESKQKACDWLNIVRTALIFVDEKNSEFSKKGV